MIHARAIAHQYTVGFSRSVFVFSPACTLAYVQDKSYRQLIVAKFRKSKTEVTKKRRREEHLHQRTPLAYVCSLAKHFAPAPPPPRMESAKRCPP